MKTIQTLTVLFILLSGLISCQTIADLETAYPPNTPNTYYKDIGNNLNAYEGAWVYDDGISYIKIILVNKIKFPVWQYFKDTIIGGFLYKKNEVELINNLNIINSIQTHPIKYPISGNRLGDVSRLNPFHQFTSDIKRLNLSFKENGCYSDLYVRILQINGQPAIQIDKVKPFEQPQDCNPIIPNGFYYLIKQ
jgi:hypothetical protein